MASMRAAFFVKCVARGRRHDLRFHHLACGRGRMGLVRAVIGTLAKITAPAISGGRSGPLP